MLRGNMAVGVHQGNLIIRVGKEKYAAALKKPGARPFDLTGRPLTGFVFVDPVGYPTQAALKKWVEAGLSFAKSLPPKM